MSYKTPSLNIQGKPINNSLSIIGATQDGYAITWDNADGYWQAKPVAPPEANLVGDVTGSENSNTVIKIQTKTLDPSLALLGAMQDGYILTWDNVDGYWKADPIIQRGTSSLTLGVSPAITANITINSRILTTRMDKGASTALGSLSALSTNRVVGTPGSFIVTAEKMDASGVETGDASTFDWIVLEN